MYIIHIKTTNTFQDSRNGITYIQYIQCVYIQYMYSNTCYDQAERQNCKRLITHTNFLKKLTTDIIGSKYMIYLNYQVIL